MASWKWTGDVTIGTAGQKIMTGAGDPTGTITAVPGTIYLRTDAVPGASLYMKETGTGNTGWAAVTTGGTTALTTKVDGVANSLQGVLNFTSTGLNITDEGSGTVNFDVEVTTVPYSNLDGAITTVGEALDHLIPLAFTSMTNAVGTMEVGSTLSSLTVNWLLNDTASALQFTAVPATFSPAAPASISPTSSTSQLFAGSYTSTTPTTLTWTLQAVKGAQTVLGSTSVSFKLKNYFGVSSLSSLTSSAVLALGGSEFASSKVKTAVVYNCSGGKYPYFCYPFSYGDPTSVTVGGLPFTDYTVSTVLLTNASGFSVNYKVVRFNNLQTGILTVSWA